jgi:hypothetical protein
MNITYLKWTGRIMLAVIALGSTGMAGAQQESNAIPYALPEWKGRSG